MLPYNKLAISQTNSKKTKQGNSIRTQKYNTVFSTGFLSLLFVLFHHKVASHFSATQWYLHKLPINYDDNYNVHLARLPKKLMFIPESKL